MKRALDHRRCLVGLCHPKAFAIARDQHAVSGTTTPPPNKPSRSVAATAQRGASEVAVDSRFVLADLGCGQGFQQVVHPFQATNITNDSEQLVAVLEAAN